MPDPYHDAGVFAALIQRFERFRLPRVLQLKQKVDAGKTLSGTDLSYLRRSLDRTRYIVPLVDRNPQYQQFASRAIHLYSQVVTQGLENETNRQMAT